MIKYTTTPSLINRGWKIIVFRCDWSVKFLSEHLNLSYSLNIRKFQAFTKFLENINEILCNKTDIYPSLLPHVKTQYLVYRLPLVIESPKNNHEPSKLDTCMVPSPNMNRPLLTHCVPSLVFRVKLDHLRHTFSYFEIFIVHFATPINHQGQRIIRFLQQLACHPKSSKFILNRLPNNILRNFRPFDLACILDLNHRDHVRNFLIHTPIYEHLMSIVKPIVKHDRGFLACRSPAVLEVVGVQEHFSGFGDWVQFHLIELDEVITCVFDRVELVHVLEVLLGFEYLWGRQLDVETVLEQMGGVFGAFRVVEWGVEGLLHGGFCLECGE